MAVAVHAHHPFAGEELDALRGRTRAAHHIGYARIGEAGPDARLGLDDRHVQAELS